MNSVTQSQAKPALPKAYVKYLDSQSGVQPFALAQSLAGNSVRRVGNTDYVTHLVESMDTARQVADAICTQSMLPIYFGTGYAVSVPHIQRMDYGSELVLRFFPKGEDRSGSADDYTCVHTFSFIPHR